MEELYSETYLKAKPSPKRMLIRSGFIALCILLVYIAVFVIQSGPVLFFAIVVDGFIFYFMPSANIAYEYACFCHFRFFIRRYHKIHNGNIGQIDFDIIIAGNKRKTKKRTDLEKIDIVAPEGSPSLNQYSRLPLVDFSSGVKSDRHFIAVSKSDNGQERIKFTPDEKLIENMKFKGRSKIQC